MITIESVIEQYEENGEKTGWRFIYLPKAIAEKIKPDNRKSFRIRGLIDEVQISGLAAMPVGAGNFILALKASIRKALNKDTGDSVVAQLEEHLNFKVVIPPDLEICLLDEPHLMENFNKLAPSHQHYFIKYVEDAKTFATKSKRIAMVVGAMDNNWDYGKMIREERGRR